LVDISLSFNRIEKEGIVWIAEVMESNCSVQKISLFGKEIEYDCAMLICKSIQKNRIIQEFDF
jgi:hypothetical protein